MSDACQALQTRILFNFKINVEEAKEMARWLKTLTALPEDTRLLLGTHIRWLQKWKCSYKGTNASDLWTPVFTFIDLHVHTTHI